MCYTPPLSYYMYRTNRVHAQYIAVILDILFSQIQVEIQFLPPPRLTEEQNRIKKKTHSQVCVQCVVIFFADSNFSTYISFMAVNKMMMMMVIMWISLCGPVASTVIKLMQIFIFIHLRFR